MNCNEAEKYIYLCEEYSADDNFLEKFEEHLQTCTECSRKYKEMLEYSMLVSKIREIDYSSDLQSVLTKDIIESVKSFSGKHSSPQETFWNIFYLPSIRLAAASILLLISLSYLFQEFTATKSIHSLENKYEVLSEKEIYKTNMASTQEMLNSASSLYKFISGDKKFLELPGELMLIKKSELIKLLEEYINNSEDLTNPNYKKYLVKVLGEEKYQTLLKDREKLNKLLGR